MPTTGGGVEVIAAPEDLLPLALSRPHDAIAGAKALLESGPAPLAASIAHQASGISLRQLGDVDAAIREMRIALRLATKSGQRRREADVLATLGATLGRAGHGKQGLACLDRAVAGSRGALAGRVLIRRADVLLVLGRHQEALDDLRGAVTRLRRAGDQVWEARSRNYRGFAHLALGSTRQADADFAVAERLYAASGQEFEYAEARQNRGLVAFARGDLPLALGYLGEAGQRFEAVGVVWPDLAIDRCRVLLAAGLTTEALDEADRAVVRMETEGGQATKKAELLFTAATAALGATDPATARERAEQARRLFSAQGRAWWSARATLIQLEARHQGGERGPQLLRRVTETATRLDRLGAAEAPAAHLLAGRLALVEGRRVAADRHLEHAAKLRRGAPPLARAASLLGKALRSEAGADVRGMLAACDRGLDALDEHRLTMGATELRARATAHGAELARLALREALQRKDARQLLLRSERWRATALAVPAVRPPGDGQLIADLAALRDVARRLETSGEDLSTPAGAALGREQRRLEDAVRSQTLKARGHDAAASAPPFDVEELIDELGETVLVELIEVDDVLYAVVVRDRQVRLHTVGPLSAAAHEVERARFRLRWLARGRPPTGPSLEVIGARLSTALLGAAAADLGDGPLVVVPPSRLQALPWALVPALAGRAVSVAPSSATWLWARRLRPPNGRRVVLVLGPGLTAGRAEISQLAERYPAATVLAEGAATAEQVLRALDGAWLGHIAAHGTFRSDNPLFSSLRLDDGPLTVYDFERLRHAPYRLVLSSCESGLANPVGADELLGLTSSLVPLGAAGILASVVPVNDPAAVPLMTALHGNLHAGRSLAEAFSDARTTGGDDPVAHATGCSFVALGA
ncbi:CHAT domain-containing protein [Kribbella sp. VKM Ac-2568]|uniref:CHAT domain-containing protein n=1 Tax=Kribbella sp. VKM Ac-2568 TaxID=2512219 RepID=UPI0010440EB2|nr:CHAT domain-containing protein [Kribbella sp. VKM Ac-2568]